MKKAAYHIAGYGPGRTSYSVGDVGHEGPEGFVFVRKFKGVYVIAKQANRGAIPDELLGLEIPCRVVVSDARLYPFGCRLQITQFKE